MLGTNARQRGLVDSGHLNANMPGSNHLVMAVDKGQESSLMALAPDPWCYSNGGLGSGGLLIWAGM